MTALEHKLAVDTTTPEKYILPTPKTRWVGIWFFIIIHLVGIAGTPLYLHFYGFRAADWILFGIWSFLSSLGITIGYHRLFAHAAFKTGKVFQFLLLFFGGSTFEQSCLKWASQHRQHHRFTDTDLDPYDISKGFWYAHIGWIIQFKHKVNYDNAPDLTKNPLVMHQHRWYGVWSVASGIAVPVLIGFLYGSPLGAFIISVCLRLVVVMNSAFFINSFCHMFGSRPYDKTISARDHWLGAFLVNGEGYHNFHHRFPSDYRNGIRWFDWDPSKWLVRLLSYFKLTWDLRCTSSEAIKAARNA